MSGVDFRENLLAYDGRQSTEKLALPHKLGGIVGHYLSEMESADEAATREAKARTIEENLKRGYKYVTIHNKEMLHHCPCGQAVFDPVTHEKYCPAKG